MTESTKDDGPKSLSGGNPQIEEAEGDGPEHAHLDIHEDDQFDDVQLTSSIRQASELPGEAV
jgi:hypothetical protein